MSYLGRGTDKISNIEVLDNITFDGSSSYSITKNSVAFVPNSAQSLLISIDGVVQATNFTVSSSTIDFGVAIPSTSSCDFFLHYGIGLITTPADGTVTTAKLGSSAVTTAKIADDAVTKDKVSNLMYPAFEASLSSTQSVSNDTTVKIQINSENLDTDNCYDNSTNYRFTPTVAGKYFVYAKARAQSSADDLLRDVSVLIYKNGSLEIDHIFLLRNNYQRVITPSVFGIVDMNGSSDYVELYGKITQPTGTPTGFVGGSRTTLFGAYRIGD